MSPIVANVWTCPACGYITKTSANLIPATAPFCCGVTPSSTNCVCGYSLTRTDTAA